MQIWSTVPIELPKRKGKLWCCIAFFFGVALSATAFGQTFNISEGEEPFCNTDTSFSANTLTCNGNGRFIFEAGSSTIANTNSSLVAANGFDLSSNTIGTTTNRIDMQSTYGSFDTSGTNIIYGDITTTWGNVELSNTTLYGDVTTNGTITLSNATIVGNLSSQNGINSTNSDITGDLTATNGPINIDGGTLDGNIDTNNNNQPISISNATITSGSVITAGNTITISDSTLGTSSSPVPISTDNNVIVENSTIYGDISANTSYDSISITGDSPIYGTCTPDNTLCDTSPPPSDTEVILEDTPGLYSFTVPANVTEITVEGWGSGGTGGDASAGILGPIGGVSRGAPGGGGGAYARDTVPVTPGETIFYRVGNANASGAHLRDSWFSRSNNAAASFLRAAHGGDADLNGTLGAPGGAAADSVGQVLRDGGSGADSGAGLDGGGGGSSAAPGASGNDATGREGADGPPESGPGGDGATTGQSRDGQSPLVQPGGGGGGAHSRCVFLGLICGSGDGGKGAHGQIRLTYGTTPDQPEDSLEYIELSFNTTSVTCEPLEVTFKACADDDCDTLYAAPVDVTATSTGSGSWAGGTDFTFTEQTTRSFTRTEVHSTRLGATAIDPEPEGFPEVLCNGSTDCEVEFVETALRLTDANGDPLSTVNFTSGELQPDLFYLSAIRTDDEDADACVPALSNTTQEVLWAAATLNPDSPAADTPRQLELNGTAINTVEETDADPVTPLIIDFDGNGISSEPFSVRYNDAGRLKLLAETEIDVEDETLMLELLPSSQQTIDNREWLFWPDRLVITDIHCAAGEDNDCLPNTAEGDTVTNPGATNADGGPFVYAGAAFVVTLEARNALDEAHTPLDQMVTRNFGQEGSPGFSASLAATLLLPDPEEGGHSPDLTGQTTLSTSDFENGSASVTLQWPEVGIIELTAELDSYLGQNNDQTEPVTSGPVGRFIPYEFSVEWQGASIGSPNTGNDEDGYVYQGQAFSWSAPPSVVLTPYSTRSDSTDSLSGSITENYTGDFNKLPDTFSDTLFSLTRHEDMTAGGPLVISSFDANMDSGLPQNWQRELLVDLNQQLTLSKVDTLPSDNQMPDPISLQFTYETDAFKDSDDVCLRNNGGECIGLTENINSNTKLLYGRLTLDAAQGPTGRTLRLPINVEIWDDDRFKTHSPLDSLSGNPEGVLPDLAADQFEALDRNDEKIDSISITLPDAMESGEADLSIDYSGSQPLRARIQGTDLPQYLQYPWTYGQHERLEPGESGELVGPRAIASFGTYEGRPPVLFMLPQGR